MRTVLKESVTKEQFEALREVLESNGEEVNNYFEVTLANGATFCDPQWIVFNECTRDGIKDAIGQLVNNSDEYIDQNFICECDGGIESIEDCYECEYRKNCEDCDYVDNNGDCDNGDCESCDGDISLDIEPILTEGRILFEEGFRENYLKHINDSAEFERTCKIQSIRLIEGEINNLDKFHVEIVEQIQTIS